jgi:hypothetical protein
MRARAQPLVNFNIRVPVETDNLRRQLQGETGLSGSELVTKALQVLAAEQRREPEPAA